MPVFDLTMGDQKGILALTPYRSTWGIPEKDPSLNWLSVPRLGSIRSSAAS